ncbi:General stress protein 13 [Companilactobacillus tucceti DSM 20183]|uniref:General stress protein 13 n=1 Tax=Companilactobacillus tucceti DSM 20183 TaxID=1423811 RepID=A0A0R1IWS2_9LACO|nr:CvfD/Ygs/GSP13 family RNA-binding post-transcriptional regulator [Companilactobacillus tucceti]KRK63510.1 General stress protein 13 [Companilactobacillus tucceti DSM 20183]
MKIGDRLSGQVSGVQKYGIFVKLENGKQGLIHISELRHGYVPNVENMYRIGDQVEVIVMDIDEYNQKISLSMRALHKQKIGRPILHKHFWTNYKDKIGFQTIQSHRKQWIDEGISEIIEKK